MRTATVVRVTLVLTLAIVSAALLVACGGGDVECRMEFMGPVAPGFPAPVYDPAHPIGWVEVCE